MAAILPIEKDGVFNVFYTVELSRKTHLFKGREIIYLIEAEDEKRLLTNNGYGSRACLYLHSVQFDIKITKMVDGNPQSSCRIQGSNKEHKRISIELDVLLEKHSVIKMLSCNNDTVQLVND